jgi:hypothetical protein
MRDIRDAGSSSYRCADQPAVSEGIAQSVPYFGYIRLGKASRRVVDLQRKSHVRQLHHTGSPRVSVGLSDDNSISGLCEQLQLIERTSRLNLRIHWRERAQR